MFIEFDPGLVALHDAPALKGDFSPEHALDTLLARTDLTYHVKDAKNDPHRQGHRRGRRQWPLRQAQRDA